jgi:hypothetical protein
MKILFQLILTFISGSLYGQNSSCDLFNYLKDSTFDNRSFLKYELLDSTITVAWGNSEFRRTLPPYSCNIAPVGIPIVKWHNKTFIGLTFSCGNPCWALIVLPMNQEDQTETFYYSYDWDVHNNQVAYLEGDVLKVVELTSNRILEFPIQPNCNSAFVGYCIDSVNLETNELYVKWRTDIAFDGTEFKEIREKLEFEK